MSISLQFKSGSSASFPNGSDKPQVFARAMVGTPIQEGPRTAEGRPPASTADIQAATARMRATEQKSDSDISLQVTAPRLKPPGFGLLNPVVFGAATAAGLKFAGPALLAGAAGPVTLAAGVAIGGTLVWNAFNSGRFAAVSHENLEDTKLGVRGDLFPDVGVDEIEAGPQTRVRDDAFGNPNGAIEGGPDIAFEQTTGGHERVDLEAWVMASPPDNRPEDALPDPLADGEAMIHVAGVPPVDFARRQRLTGFPDGKAPEGEQERMDILVRLYSQNSPNLQVARVKKLAAETRDEVRDNLAPGQYETPDKHGKSWSNLTEADYAALNMYISGNFEFNPALGDNFQRVMKPNRYVSLRDATTVRNTLQAAEVLSQALAKVPVYEGTAHRGFKLSAEQIEAFVPGNIVSIPAYMSASLGKAPAHPFDKKPVIFSITGEAANIDPANGFEREVIFAPGNYAVLDRREVGGKTLIRLRQLK